jgi:hypothetical protein
MLVTLFVVETIMENLGLEYYFKGGTCPNIPLCRSAHCLLQTFRANLLRCALVHTLAQLSLPTVLTGLSSPGLGIFLGPRAFVSLQRCHLFLPTRRVCARTAACLCKTERIRTPRLPPQGAQLPLVRSSSRQDAIDLPHWIWWV